MRIDSAWLAARRPFGRAREGRPARGSGLARAFTASAGTTIVVAVASGLFGVIATRAMGPFERGLLATAAVWSGVLASIIGIGLPQAVTYFVGAQRERAAAYTTTALVVGGTGGLVFGTLGAVLALVLGGEARVAIAILFAGMAPLVVSGFGIAAVLGTGAYRTWALLRPVAPVSALAAVIVVVLAGGDTATIMALVTAGSWVLQAAVVLRVLRRRALLGGPERAALRDLISYGWRQLVAGVAWLLTYKLDQLYLSIAVTPTALGLYAVGASVAELIAPVAASTGAIMLARVASGGGAEVRASLRQALTFAVAVAAPLAILAAVFAHELLVNVFGASFDPATSVLRIYVWGAVALAVASVLSDTLRGLGHPLDPAKAEVGGAICTIVLLSLLVPAYGVEGAAAASVASYTLVALMLALLLIARLRRAPAV
jgi:O-antigen/teichoic acid export membrane protein